MDWDGVFPEPITIKEFEDTIININTPAIVLFYSEKCPKCRKIFPILQELQPNYVNKISFHQVNGKADTGLEARWEIKMYPTMIVFIDKEIELRVEGSISKINLKNILEEVANENKT